MNFIENLKQTKNYLNINNSNKNGFYFSLKKNKHNEHYDVLEMTPLKAEHVIEVKYLPGNA